MSIHHEADKETATMVVLAPASSLEGDARSTMAADSQATMAQLRWQAGGEPLEGQYGKDGFYTSVAMCSDAG